MSLSSLRSCSCDRVFAIEHSSQISQCIKNVVVVRRISAALGNENVSMGNLRCPNVKKILDVEYIHRLTDDKSTSSHRTFLLYSSDYYRVKGRFGRYFTVTWQALTSVISATYLFVRTRSPGKAINPIKPRTFASLMFCHFPVKFHFYLHFRYITRNHMIYHVSLLSVYSSSSGRNAKSSKGQPTRVSAGTAVSCRTRKWEELMTSC